MACCRSPAEEYGSALSKRSAAHEVMGLSGLLLRRLVAFRAPPPPPQRPYVQLWAALCARSDTRHVVTGWFRMISAVIGRSSHRISAHWSICRGRRRDPGPSEGHRDRRPRRQLVPEESNEGHSGAGRAVRDSLASGEPGFHEQLGSPWTVSEGPISVDAARAAPIYLIGLHIAPRTCARISLDARSIVCPPPGPSACADEPD